MAYAITPGFAGVDLTVTGADLLYPVGTRVEGSDGNSYIYVQANEASAGAIDQYAICVLLEDGQADMLTTGDISTTLPAKLVVAQVAITDNYYGWAVEKGINFTVLAKANCAADVKLYTTATKGHVDDDNTSTTLIQGLRLNAAIGGSDGSASASAASEMFANGQG